MLSWAMVARGETVFVTSASGGVGFDLVQLVTVRGARVIALVGPGKESRAFELGADGVVARGDSDLPRAVSKAAGGHPVDVVADMVGGGSFPDLLNVLRSEVPYVSAGPIAGPLVRLDPRTLYLRHLEMISSTLGTGKEFADLVGYVEDGKLRPLSVGTYPLVEIKRAKEDFKKKDFFGKLVLV